MIKITDDAYFLPVIDAQLAFQEFGSGRTKPMLIRGICRTTCEKSDYVVKYCTGQMSVESSCRELLASFIAKELDMNVTEPALIHISSEFVDSLIGKDGYKNANNSIGINYGSKYFEGFMEFVPNPKLNEKQTKQAEQIFALDIFISNADRRRDKQNMLTNGEKIIIFDHELAFGFVMELIKNTTPWLIRPIDRIWIENHFFYSILRTNTPDFSTFVDSFEMLDEIFWNKAESLIPNEWKTTQIQQIRNNLTSLIDNKAIFLQQLNNILV